MSATRERVLEVARSYLGTPYHDRGLIKGVGVDCATLLALVYTEAGAIPEPAVPLYSPQWFLHRSDELYLGAVAEYAREIAGPPQPGDVAMYRFGRCFAHGAIVLDWPGEILHAHKTSGFVTLAGAWDADLRGRAVRFFTLWGE